MDKSPILAIPNEMIACILNELDLPQLIKCRLICKKFKFIIDNHQQYNISKMDKSMILSLPNEIIASILNELNILQIINCRLISKKVKFIIDNNQRYNIKKEKLIIFFLSQIRIKGIPIDYKNSFHLDEFAENNELKSILRSNFFSKFYFNLKELYFNFYSGFYDRYFDFKILNQFSKLEILHFNFFISNEDLTINLPNLKKLYILDNTYPANYHETNYIIIIDTKLEEVEIAMSYNKFIFTYPEYINHTTCRFFYNTKRFKPSISKFKNIKSLRLLSWFRIEKIKKTIKILKNLQIIYIDSWKFYDDEVSTETINYLMRIKDKKKTKIKKIYFWGVELTDATENQNIIEDNSLKYQLLNYKLFKNTLYRSEQFKYDILINYLKEDVDLFKDLKRHNQLPELPFDFFLKFNNLKRVIVNSIRLDDEFIVFLGNCNCLTYLKIRKCELNQSLLDQLPNVSNHLYKLVLRDVKNFENQKFNFDFICKLKNISVLKMRIQIDIQIALKLLNDINSLKNFLFYYLERPISLTKFKTKTILKKINNEEDSYWLFFDLNKKISLEYINLNKEEYKHLFEIRYINEYISRIGLNYEQLEEFIQEIPITFANESNNMYIGNRFVYESGSEKDY
jgi:hypothetical protein